MGSVGYVKNKLRAIIAFTVLVCLSQIGCGQTNKPSLDKAQALRDVKVKSVAGWKEVISETGRFRILFPNEPEIRNSGTPNMQGYKLMSGDRGWFAYYADLNKSKVSDEAGIREAYHKSVEDMARKGGTLLRQNDISLNGRLGIEVVFQGRGATSFIRSFLIGQRMYVVEVDSKDVIDKDTSLPTDVQQFFDSFTFWE
ncbi:MAG: hypothetical protein QOC96_697 [Acidobacteriota bacterium]|jgi:hypothetical protein|nr:hypothetical protein [Acidobacteriota bacterium]